jgi:hypothetical protein
MSVVPSWFCVPVPEYIAELVGDKEYFISTLKQYLVNKSYYSLEEFFKD